MPRKTKNGRTKKDKKMEHNCPVGVEHDRQYKHQGNKGGDYGFNPLTAGNTGGKNHMGGNGKMRSAMTDAERKKKGIGMGADFGSWQAPSRRLNPNNKQDRKIIQRGTDSIFREDKSYIPCQGINKDKYNKNFNEINWGSEPETDKNGVRKPKRTKKVYK